MKRSVRSISAVTFALLILAVTLSSAAVPAPPPNITGKMNARYAEAYGKLPLSFVENKGQMDKRVRYVIRGPQASAFFCNDGVTFDLWEASKKDRLDKRDIPGKPNADKLTKPEKRKHAVLKLTFKGADPKRQVKGIDMLPGKVNYMIGKDKSKWHTNIPTYKGVIYKNVWQGVDVIYRGDRRQLKYDIKVNPGADVRKVRLQYDGAQKIWLDKKGDLHIRTSVTEFIEKVPGIYQEKAGKKINVIGGYKLLDARTVGFSVKNADPKLLIVIDPASDLVYSTLLGGTDPSGIQSISVDSSGCAYVTGYTDSSDFPTTPGAYKSMYSDGSVFVTKLNPSGSRLEYSTFLGGGGHDYMHRYGIVVDSSGCAYVTGHTYSRDFPTTPGAYDRISTATDRTTDAFVTKLNPSGSGLVYSTFLGNSGQDYGDSLAVDSSGCAYVTGYTYSPDFPTTPGAYDSVFRGGSAFVTKLNPSGSGLEYSTFLYGSHNENGYGIAVDSSGCAYVTGYTDSWDFPTTPGAYNREFGLNTDAFVTKLNLSGSKLEYSTLLGGCGYDSGYSIAVDSSGCAYVTGYTQLSDFPVTPGAFRTSYGGDYDVFVSKLNMNGSWTFPEGTQTGASNPYTRPSNPDLKLHELKGAMHVHWFFDGPTSVLASHYTKSPVEVEGLYADLGYNFVALTEHDHVTPNPNLTVPDGYTFVHLENCEEISTGFNLETNDWDWHHQYCHMLGIGISDGNANVSFPYSYESTLMNEIIAPRGSTKSQIAGMVKQYGGLAFLPHPKHVTIPIDIWNIALDGNYSWGDWGRTYGDNYSLNDLLGLAGRCNSCPRCTLITDVV